MKVFTTLLSLGLAASVAVAQTPGPTPFTLSYNDIYQDRNQPLEPLACGGGQNGLVTRGYDVLGRIPNFDNVGAGNAASYNSQGCGACYKLIYRDNSAYITLVDNTARPGLFVISTNAVKALTRVNGTSEGYDKGTVTLDDAYEVDDLCAFPKIQVGLWFGRSGEP
ncbi:cs antigen [Moniliophthora roreri MCA 2997]|uniref:Cs antigen n=2 Tax=Moniliophthora roreri TaxID=221103 RepID=V2X0V7_MONRO|nr:cerato-platanin 11 [Moniliophthora roreri]ESK87452.1 cs antigen [Moniliophthora roreri MCA 2997]